MPRNQLQRMVFAFLTVVVTVNAFVFYSLFVVKGDALVTIQAQGGVYMFARYLPIWAVVLIEFGFAYILEVVMGSPCSFKLASKVFDPRKNHPMMFESAIICATVGLMCPAMSFIAAWLYYPYYEGFDSITLFANWMKLVCFNFPFAFFTQLFFIQPLIRTIFKFLFQKDIAQRERMKSKPQSEAEAIEDVIISKKIIKEDES